MGIGLVRQLRDQSRIDPSHNDAPPNLDIISCLFCAQWWQLNRDSS